MKIVLLCSTILMFALLPSAAIADSFFSSAGLGLPHYIVSSQATGMGGAGIGVQQYLTLNEMNPASIDLKGMTMVTAGLQAEMIDHTIDDASAATRQANASGFRMAVPMMDQLALLFSFKPRMTTRYNVASEITFGDDRMTRTLDVKGGINTGSIGLQYTVIKGVAIGAMFDYYFGAFEEMWKTDFDTPGFLDSRENTSSHFYGKGAHFGLFWQPHRLVSLGAVWSMPANLNAETSIVTGGGKSLDPIRQKAYYPAGLGFGAAVNLKKFTFATDVYSQAWSNFRLDDAPTTAAADYFRVGAGVEYLDSKDHLANYFRRISYRLGAYHARLPFVDSEGGQAAETVGSLGLGFPFRRNAGRVDIALEFGARHSSDQYPYSEKLLRLSVFVVSAERWFIRNF